MKTKELVFMSLLVGMGAALNSILPGFIFGMKPDLPLVMMFLGIILFPKVKHTLLLGILTGIITALTTSFPLGQIPNIIDKPITAFFFLGCVLLVRSVKKQLLSFSLLTAIGTLVSGSIFLGSALLIVSLPGGASFSLLLITVVLPTTVINAVAMTIIYPVVLRILSRMKIV